jgi:hypothetical protein
MKINRAALSLTGKRIAWLDEEMPDFVRAVLDAAGSSKRTIAAHVTTFYGDGELLQVALLFADLHKVRVFFSTTEDAIRLQSDDRLAGLNVHRNAMPAEDFRYEMGKRGLNNHEGEDETEPQK